MGKFRIYPDKSNTLIENSEFNTGKNEVMELQYGVYGIKRHLIHFDFGDYNSKYASGSVPHITGATATFNMDSIYPVFERYPYEDAYPAEASQVDIKVIQQFWDAGTGHDFWGKDVVRGKSNWYSASSTSHWALPGGDFLYTVFSGTVENADVNLSCEVTNEIELWNTFTGQNHGFVVKFSDDVEALSASTWHMLKYYTSNANTKYKLPYIELSWDSQIRDERDEVCAGSTNRLYLYLRKNGTFSNANNISGVTVSFGTTGYTTVTASTIHNPVRGIYYVDIPFPSTGATGVSFTDNWVVQYEAGMTYTSILQTGSTVDASAVWQTSDSIDPTRYTIEIPNMIQKYSQGDIVYLQVNCYVPYTNTREIVKNMEYKIDLLDGNIEIPFVDWEGVSYSTTENFIILDTSWLHTDYRYQISVRYTVDGSLSSEAISKKFWIK